MVGKVYSIVLMTTMCCFMFEGCHNSLYDLFVWQWIHQFRVALRVRWLLWLKEHPEFCWWARLGNVVATAVCTDSCLLLIVHRQINTIAAWPVWLRVVAYVWVLTSAVSVVSSACDLSIVVESWTSLVDPD